MTSKKVNIRDAFKRDGGRGRIRIDPEIIAEMNLRTGNVIEISHHTTGKKTAALLYPAKLEDLGSSAIRIDSSLRRNIGGTIGEVVNIRRIDDVLAEKITFAALDTPVILKRPDQLSKMLENRVITKGDILSFNANGERIDFIVVDHSPKADAVRVHLNTKIIISEKSHKESLIHGKALENKTVDSIEDQKPLVQNFKNLTCSTCGSQIKYCPNCGTEFKNDR